MSTRPVVVGVDASQDSDLAVVWTAREAHRAGAPLRVVHAIPEPLSTDLVASAEARGRADAVLAGAVQAATDAYPDIVVTSDRLEGLGLTPADALVAESEGASLVVVGARGHSEIGGLLLGSVSQAVSRHAACPAVVVRRRADRRAERVVVGVDGSPPSMDALAFALDSAERDGHDVTALLAVHLPTVRGTGYGTPLSERSARKLLMAQDQVDGVVAAWRAKYPQVALRAEAVPGEADDVLVEASAHAAMVVVGSRRREALTGLLLGSVGQSVLSHARCPVAVVR